jgi:N-acetylglucosaminyl-diphospho-decaprenol L-rhamnosyltransferase
MVQISFITVTMNSRKTIEPLFVSFFETIGNKIRYEYIVVDNCSNDGTPAYIRETYPQVKLIETNKIKGFAENNNIAINISSGAIIALINPDIVFLPNTIETILSHMERHREIGLVGPMLLNTDGSIQNSARRFLNFKSAFLRLLTLGSDKVPLKSVQKYLSSYSVSAESQEVDWVIGAAMFVRREALSDVGLLDTKYFLYIEDQDLCFQMWKKKWKVTYLTSARLIHDHQRSSARKITKKTFWHVQSIFYFLRKNYLTG